MGFFLFVMALTGCLFLFGDGLSSFELGRGINAFAPLKKEEPETSFQSEDNVETPPPPTETIEEQANVCIRGIFLTNNPENLHSDDEYEGVYFCNVCPPGPSRSLENQLCAILIGQPLTKERILEAQQAIVCYYKEYGHPLVLVYIPEQKISKGILNIVVIESKIGNICFTGNCHFSACQLQKNLRLQECDYIDLNIAQQDLIWINRNPFRNVFLVLDPGEEEYTTNLRFITEDYRPYRLFVGSDNTGYESTGKERLFAGIRLGNLFLRDQQLTYQYTTSADFGRFYAHTAQYIVPFPWRHLIDFYGGYSGIRAVMPIDGMTSRGHAWQASVRYVIPFCARGCYNSEVRLGLDYKQTDVNLILDAIPILGNQTVITQLALGYYGSYQHHIANTSFEFLLFYSPGDIFPHQSDRAYQTLRPFAESDYVYFRGAIIPLFTLPNCSEIVVKSEFQWANQNLLSSEQFGLGGLDTVRGYDQRILNTDNGFLLSGEIRSRPFCPLFKKNCSRSRWERLQLLAFLDYGFGTNHKPIPGAKNFFYLLGTGVGLRYHYNYNVSVRFNWGYPIHQRIAPNLKQDKSMINYSAIISF